jgi:hypothetical protein
MMDFTKILPAGQAKIEADIIRELEYSHNGWILDNAVHGCLTDEELEESLLRDFGLALTEESKAMVMRCIDLALAGGY